MVTLTTGNVGTMQTGDVFEGTKSTVSTQSNTTTTIPFQELESLLPSHKETIEIAKKAAEKGDTEMMIDALTTLIQAGGRSVTKWIIGKGLIG